MSYKKAFDQMKYDVRMKDYNLANGLLSEQELKSFQDALLDSSANMEEVTLEDNDTYDTDGPNYI